MSQSKMSAGTDEELNIDSMSIEELFEKTKEAVARLEDEDIPLESAFKEYEQGVVLMKALGEKLSGVEERVKKITSDGVIDYFEGE